MTAALTHPGIRVIGKPIPGMEQVLTPQALNFLAELHLRFNPTREKLLQERQNLQKNWNQGKLPQFLTETAAIRSSNWKVGAVPADLQDRRVEITGPVDRKMMINALNSGAKVFMADFEDATSPTWENEIAGQMNCRDAIRRTLSYAGPDGKKYELKSKLATLVVRPRGWHLPEEGIQVDGKPMSGSLVDFGLYFFHNAQELLARESGPYFYLPKLESHLEARLWNDVFVYAQKTLGLPVGTIKATVLIETILAAYQMDEILYELKDHIVALNAGRWDYIFSVIKKFRERKDFVLPDRAQITMAVPFMKAYTELLVRTCHHRGAHAIGGMAAFIPSRKDAEVTENALKKVREDKEREARAGFDGTWVAHPDLVPVAMEIFNQHLGTQPHQKNKLREDVTFSDQGLLKLAIEGGKVTETGIRNNINVALQYIESWLAGMGAVAIHHLMEDAATAEISRSQLWQWIRCSIQYNDGKTFTASDYKKFRDEEVASLKSSTGKDYSLAMTVLDELVLSDEFSDFLTLKAYSYLNAGKNEKGNSIHGHGKFQNTSQRT